MASKTPKTNLEIAELLRDVAAAYQLKGEAKNKFRIVAYERAADAVEHASSELKDLWDEGKLNDVPGIGESMTAHLDDLFKNGHSKHFDEVLKGLPPSIFKLMELPGIGVKTAHRLVTSLKIGNTNPVADLESLAKAGKIATLDGFGEQSQEDIIKSIGRVRKRVKRHLLPYAMDIAQDIIAWLKKDKNIIKVEALGSLRRKASTIGDLDIAIASTNPQVSLEHFTNYPKKQRTLEVGDVSSSIITTGGMQVDVIALPKTSFGSLLQHFTGSKHHNVALREYALKKGLSLSERGIKVVSKAKILTKNDILRLEKVAHLNKKTEIYEFADEKKFYNFLGLTWIPPEIREGLGEIEQAKLNKLPKLIQLSEVRGDLQIHSNFDIETSHDLGQSSMEEVIEKANSLGYEYIAFTEHNPSHSKHSVDEIINILKKKKTKIEKLNTSLRGSLKRVFNSLEIDILPNGSLPVSDEGLKLLDFALVSIHSSFDMPKRKMTERILRALSHPKVKIWAHPTGRLLQKRESIEANYREIFEFCVKNNKFIEINCDPARLDLPDFFVKEAMEMGVKFTLGTDAHHKGHMDNMLWGVSVARRGWLEKKHVLNALTLKDFEKMVE